MTSRPLIILGLVIIAIAVVAAAGYIVRGQNGSAPVANLPAASSTPPAAISPAFYNSTSTPVTTPVVASPEPSNLAPAPATVATPLDASTTVDIPFPASSTASTASWLIYTDPQNRYSTEYPSDLQESPSGNALNLAFPTNSYFHWPLLDTAVITASVSPSCPHVANAGADGQSSAQFSLNGYQFTRTVGIGTASGGQRTVEVAYDTQSGGQCYHLDLSDHGPNGAASQVDDASLDATYDAQHDADFAAVIGIFNGVASSFHILASGH